MRRAGPREVDKSFDPYYPPKAVVCLYLFFGVVCLILGGVAVAGNSGPRTARR